MPQECDRRISPVQICSTLHLFAHPHLLCQKVRRPLMNCYLWLTTLLDASLECHQMLRMRGFQRPVEEVWCLQKSVLLRKYLISCSAHLELTALTRAQSAKRSTGEPISSVALLLLAKTMRTTFPSAHYCSPLAITMPQARRPAPMLGPLSLSGRAWRISMARPPGM